MEKENDLSTPAAWPFPVSGVKREGQEVPDVTFKTRVRDESVEGENPYRWQDVTTADYFANKKVILFSLPGAFTPTCSAYQLPGFERLASSFKDEGIDEIYCISVNDAFVMNQWAQKLEVKNVKMIPDGSGVFTTEMGMMVKKDNLGFGERSWRYAMIVNDCVIEKMFVEPGKEDNHEEDPYDVSSPENVMKYIHEQIKVN